MVEIKIPSIYAEREGGDARLVSKSGFLIEKAQQILTPNVLQELGILECSVRVRLCQSEMHGDVTIMTAHKCIAKQGLMVLEEGDRVPRFSAISLHEMETLTFE